MTSKKCSKCKEEKSLKEFSKGKDTKIGYKSACKECLRKDYKIYREANGKKVRGRLHITNKQRYYENRLWIDALKLKKGCELCGYKEHPQALQFDHLDPATKKFTISSKLRENKQVLLEEINKCRVLCANCHSVETHRQEHHKVRRDK